MADIQRRENPQNSRNSPMVCALFDKNNKQDICLLVDARMILKWAVHFVNVTAANVQK